MRFTKGNFLYLGKTLVTTETQRHRGKSLQKPITFRLGITGLAMT